MIVISILFGLVALLFLFAILLTLVSYGFWLFLLLLAVGAFVFWIWMLIDCIKNENISSNERVVWVLVIAFTHWVGALIYFFAGRNRRKAPPITAAA